MHRSERAGAWLRGAAPGRRESAGWHVDVDVARCDSTPLTRCALPESGCRMDFTNNSSVGNLSNSSDIKDAWITISRGYTSLAVLFVSCVLFLLALYNFLRKRRHYHRSCECCCRLLLHYLTNPFFLLALTSLLPVAAYSIVLHHPWHEKHKVQLEDEFCKKGPGYLLLWFESAETLAVVFFSIYFLVYYIPFHNRIDNILNERKLLIVNKQEQLPQATLRSKCHSFCSVLCFVAIIAVCGVYTMPYVIKHTEGGSYGKVGPWCWIKPEKAQKYFWFIEEWVYISISFITLTSALILLCCVTRQQHKRYRCFPHIWWDKSVFVPFLFFYAYFLLQFVFMVIEVLVRLYKKDIQWLWYTYAIGKPVSKILLIVAALQLMSTSFRVVKRREPLIESTVHV